MTEPDLDWVMRRAGLDPTKATDWQVAMADRMIMIYTKNGVVNLRSAALALRRHLESEK